jgi:excisionase family DNA binding protein
MSRPAPAAESEPLLRYSEIALRASVSLRTVERWAYEGRVPVYRPPGSGPRMKWSDVLTYYEKYRVSPVGETTSAGT